MSSKRKSLSLLFFMLYCTAGIYCQNIEIEITGIRSGDGQFIIEVYKDSKNFEEEKPVQRRAFIKSEIKEGTMTVKMELEPGNYGLALIDDENRNHEMDYRKIRLTKEGFAFSNFFLKGFKKPTFPDFEFMVEEDGICKIEMRIRYI
jgi:uncharacterized protein (DUF2141 family)